MNNNIKHWELGHSSQFQMFVAGEIAEQKMCAIRFDKDVYMYFSFTMINFIALC